MYLRESSEYFKVYCPIIKKNQIDYLFRVSSHQFALLKVFETYCSSLF